MSSIIVSDKHISAILAVSVPGNYAEYYWEGRTNRVSRGSELTEGQILKAANWASVCAGIGEEVGEIPAFRIDTEGRPVDPVTAVKLIQSYRYQSCDSPTWKGSRADKISAALMTAAIQALPGYDEAPWLL